MTAKKPPVKQTVYLSGAEADAIRAFACESRLSEGRAMKILVVSGLQNIRDGKLEGQLNRLRAEGKIRDRELFGVLTEIVLAVRFLAENQQAGMQKRLKELRVNALAALLEKIERNENAL